MFKPFRIFLVLLVLLALLAVPTLFVPPGGFSFYGVTISYPSLTELLDVDTMRSEGFELDPELVRIDFLIDSLTNAEADREPDDTPPPHAPEDTLTTDVPLSKEPAAEPDVLAAEVLKSRLIPLEHPSADVNALSKFYNSLQNGEATTSLLRVLHYGDSQIEGDRISSFLRRRLQGRFGGGGVGLLHVVPHSHQPAQVRQSVSSNWQKLLLPDLPSGGVEHRFGVMGGHSIVSPAASEQRGGFNEAWVSFQRLGPHHVSGRNFTRVRLLYGYNDEPFVATFSYAGSTHEADMMPPVTTVNQLSWSAPLGYHNFQVDIKAEGSPLFFAFSLETPTGIMVDNIPIRGSSGTDFTRATTRSFQQIMGKLNARLIILQFGVNVVPHIVDDYTFYENQMYRQILALKAASPKAAIVLIGVSDMSRREGNRFVTYPNVELIRDAQRNAAQRAGAAFWDCYTAMGGRNSMPAWVHANPPLASKDFVHFTFRGSNLIAEMFYSALMADYEEYISSK